MSSIAHRYVQDAEHIEMKWERHTCRGRSIVPFDVLCLNSSLKGDSECCPNRFYLSVWWFESKLRHVRLKATVGTGGKQIAPRAS